MFFVVFLNQDWIYVISDDKIFEEIFFPNGAITTYYYFIRGKQRLNNLIDNLNVFFELSNREYLIPPNSFIKLNDNIERFFKNHLIYFIYKKSEKGITKECEIKLIEYLKLAYNSYYENLFELHLNKVN